MHHANTVFPNISFSMHHDTNYVSKEELSFSTTKETNLLILSIKSNQLDYKDPTTWLAQFETYTHETENWLEE